MAKANASKQLKSSSDNGSVQPGTAESISPTNGPLMIKVEFNGDIRKFQVTAERDLTYEVLIRLLQGLFRGKLTPEDQLTIKYKDEDAELITISDNADLSLALQSGQGSLRLTIYKHKQRDDAFNTMDFHQLRAEMKTLFKRVDKVLDILEEEGKDSVGQEVKLEQCAPMETESVQATLNQSSTQSGTQPAIVPFTTVKSVEMGLTEPMHVITTHVGSDSSCQGRRYVPSAAFLRGNATPTPWIARDNQQDGEKSAKGVSGNQAGATVSHPRTPPANRLVCLTGKMPPDQFPFLQLTGEEKKQLPRQCRPAEGLEVRFLNRTSPIIGGELNNGSSPE